MPVEGVGEQQLKNIARPMRVYRVATDRNAETATGPPPLPLLDKPSIAAMGYSRSTARSFLNFG
jgi:adenylate cyclase